MCGRIGLGKPERSDELDGLLSGLLFTRRYNAPPSSMVPLLRHEGATLAQWGLIPYWAGHDFKPLSNARGETVATLPSFRNAYKLRRGVIVADHFFEWQKITSKIKQPWLVHRCDKQPLLLAALWEEGEHITTAIVTTNSNAMMTPVHNRMPVVLELPTVTKWINPATPLHEIAALIRPASDDALDRYPVSRLVSEGVEDSSVADQIELGV